MTAVISTSHCWVQASSQNERAVRLKEISDTLIYSKKETPFRAVRSLKTFLDTLITNVSLSKPARSALQQRVCCAGRGAWRNRRGSMIKAAGLRTSPAAITDGGMNDVACAFH